MRYQGKIIEWNDTRGFGFVLPDEGGERVFLHIKSIPRGERRPRGNEHITYELQHDERNRPRTANVRYSEGPGLDAMALAAALAAAGFLACVAVMAFAGRAPVWTPFFYGVASLLTFATYKSDKAKAVRGEWRTPESTLHLLELLGGWPGALVAQQSLRHKNRKASFQFAFWGIVALHVGAWVLFASTAPDKSKRSQAAVRAEAAPASHGRAAKRHR